MRTEFMFLPPVKLLILFLFELSACSSTTTSPNGGFAASEARTPVVGRQIGSQYETRWFPRSARFAPNESHLIVSLCHFRYSYYCHLARYWIADARWEVLPYEPGISSAWPDYSADGNRIAYARAKCTSYECDWADCRLATMNTNGGEQKLFETRGIQMPSFAPDGQHVVAWGLVGRGRLSSGRGIIGWDIYEYDLRSAGSEELEAQVTASLFTATLTGPRYLGDGQRLLFSGYIIGNDGSRTFLIPRKLNWKPNYKNDLPGFRLQKAGYVHAHHPKYGWLVSASLVWFIPPGRNEDRDDVFNAYPFSASVADVSRTGRWVVSIQGASDGSLELGGVTSYFNRGSERFQRAPMPVMTLVDRETAAAVVMRWPADIESVTLTGVE